MTFFSKKKKKKKRHFRQIVSSEDNLHEMPKPVLGTCQSLFSGKNIGLLSTEFPQRMVEVKGEVTPYSDSSIRTVKN